MLEKGILCVILLAIAFRDWKTKEISLITVAGIAVIEGGFVVWRCAEMQGWQPLLHACAGVLPGMALWGVCKLTNEAIGEGDAWLLMAVGIGVGAVRALALLWLACFLTMVVGAVLLVKKRGTRKMRLAWAPFLWLAYVVMWSGGGL